MSSARTGAVWAACQALVTLAIGGIGAFIAKAMAMPAAALIGATLAVTGVSLCRLPTRVPVWLRNAAFAAIGCSIGSGVSADFLQLAGRWSMSLAGLVVAMVAIMAAGCWLLVGYFGQSRETALLASSPGALSYSLAMAAGGIGDSRAIMTIQSVRLLAITTCLPPLLSAVNGGGGQLAGSSASIPMLTFSVTMLLFIAVLGIGFILEMSNLPAAYLIAGVVVSGLAHYLDVVAGRPPSWFLTTSFVVTGSVIGARFTRIPLGDLKRMSLAALVGVLSSGTVAALFAYLAAKFLDLPFGQVWVAYAPGGVEAMAAMAMSLGFDSTYVATHHLFRIILLIFALPLVLRAFGSKSLGPSGEGGS